MSTRTKIIITVVALLILGMVLYFLFRKPKAPAIDLTQNPAEPAKPTPLVNTDEFPFGEGARGDNVRRLQMALNRIAPDSKILEDGVFGGKTRTKLAVSVPTTLSQLPLTKERWLKIIQLGNQA